MTSSPSPVHAAEVITLDGPSAKKGEKPAFQLRCEGGQWKIMRDGIDKKFEPFTIEIDHGGSGKKDYFGILKETCSDQKIFHQKMIQTASEAVKLFNHSAKVLGATVQTGTIDAIFTGSVLKDDFTATSLNLKAEGKQRKLEFKATEELSDEHVKGVKSSVETLFRGFALAAASPLASPKAPPVASPLHASHGALPKGLVSPHSALGSPHSAHSLHAPLGSLHTPLSSSHSPVPPGPHTPSDYLGGKSTWVKIPASPEPSLVSVTIGARSSRAAHSSSSHSKGSGEGFAPDRTGARRSAFSTPRGRPGDDSPTSPAVPPKATPPRAARSGRADDQPIPLARAVGLPAAEQKSRMLHALGVSRARNGGVALKRALHELRTEIGRFSSPSVMMRLLGFDGVGAPDQLLAFYHEILGVSSKDDLDKIAAVLQDEKLWYRLQHAQLKAAETIFAARQNGHAKGISEKLHSLLEGQKVKPYNLPHFFKFKTDIRRGEEVLWSRKQLAARVGQAFDSIDHLVPMTPTEREAWRALVTQAMTTFMHS